jgi:hypothetical protein
MGGDDRDGDADDGILDRREIEIVRARVLPAGRPSTGAVIVLSSACTFVQSPIPSKEDISIVAIKAGVHARLGACCGRPACLRHTSPERRQRQHLRFLG